MRVAFIALAVSATACGLYFDDDDDGGDPSADDRRVFADVFAEPVRDVDLLFVIDNSGSMADEQASLAAWADGSLFGLLETDFGTTFNLHVGVVSTDSGAGPFGISGCTGTGDNGVLQSDPRTATCTPPNGSFIVDVDDGTGNRIGNHAGSLAESFACIAQLGITGCGYEQTLESMKRALDGRNTQNTGFLRDDALLAVVIVSDEDDCSVVDTSMYDTSQDSLNDPLGPLSSFRCFEFGVRCEPDEPRTAGAHANCAPRTDSPYMPNPSDYADFLRGLKPQPGMVFVGGLFGNPSPVAVDWYESTSLILSPSCSVGGQDAAPGIRLAAFVDEFPGRSGFASICNGDLRQPLAQVSSRIADVANQRPCLIGEPTDVDADAPGLQLDCTTYQVAAGSVDVLPECSDGGSRPCHTIERDVDECADTDTQLAVFVDRAAPAPPSARVVVRCR
jgi:hypothetical protein